LYSAEIRDCIKRVSIFKEDKELIKGNTVKMRVEDMPFYHRSGAENGNTYISLGSVKKGGNEPYCYTQEKQCAGHICRVLAPEKVTDKALVIREDGTVWDIWLSNFEYWELIEIVTRGSSIEKMRNMQKD